MAGKSRREEWLLLGLTVLKNPAFSACYDPFLGQMVLFDSLYCLQFMLPQTDTLIP